MGCASSKNVDHESSKKDAVATPPPKKIEGRITHNRTTSTCVDDAPHRNIVLSAEKSSSAGRAHHPIHTSPPRRTGSGCDSLSFIQGRYQAGFCRRSPTAGRGSRRHRRCKARRGGEAHSNVCTMHMQLYCCMTWLHPCGAGSCQQVAASKGSLFLL